MTETICGVPVTDALRHAILDCALLVEEKLERRLNEREIDMLIMAIARYLARRRIRTLH